MSSYFLTGTVMLTWETGAAILIWATSGFISLHLLEFTTSALFCFRMSPNLYHGVSIHSPLSSSQTPPIALLGNLGLGNLPARRKAQSYWSLRYARRPTVARHNFCNTSINNPLSRRAVPIHVTFIFTMMLIPNSCN